MDIDVPNDDDIEMQEKVELSGSLDKVTEHQVWGAQGFMDIPTPGKDYRRRYLGNRYQ
ncbi:hypothetical protein ACFCYN_04735 [Gottfriedia sp. NPDC056225]|uniref:hypothetical protein n=1 Tax=Gottfriedia sp. NPDC056225 TaxID=3345751 RepID=UPI001559FBF8|nr:hypothetical protein HPK19_20530 [Arthrobacter citreus]